MKFTFNLNKKEYNMNRAKMFSLTAGFVLAMAFTLSCEDKEAKKAAEAAEAAAAAAVLSAQTAETPKKDDGSVDFGKLTLKGDVYYLNNVPFTGKAIDGDERRSWEMKDGRFHGRCAEMDNEGVQSVGNYKNGKKDGEWTISPHGDAEGADITEIWKDGKLIKERKKKDKEAKNASEQPIRIADGSVLSKYTSYHDWGTSDEFSSDVIIANVAVKDFRMYSIWDGKLSREYEQLDKFTPEKPIAVSRENMWTAVFSYLDDKSERRFFSFKYKDKPYLEELINPQFKD